jgi:hypothetical protein
MKISREKSKIMVFQGKEPVLSKICLKERTNSFTYLGYKLSFQGEVNLLQKITKYKKKTMGIINKVLKPT